MNTFEPRPSDCSLLTAPGDGRYPFGFSPASRLGIKILDELRAAQFQAKRAEMTVRGFRCADEAQGALCGSIANRAEEFARGLTALVAEIAGQRGDFSQGGEP